MKLLRILCLLLLTTSLWADYHPDIKWLSIKTEHFNIVFDSRIESDAQLIANKLENYYLSISKDMGGEIDRYTLVLPAEMTISNGYVSSVNNKSVFYPTPPTDSFAGTTKWYDLLSVHETRHMAQYSHIRNSIGQKILEFLFGSYGYAGAVLIPSYFYEGDAVLTETLLTDSGRGRSPEFERGLRTLLLSDKNYTFAKAVHGSNKDFCPNYYVLGYYLMTYLQREYGENILSEISNATGNNPFPMNFSTASMFITGESMPVVYKQVTSELRKLWEEQDSKINPSFISLISEPQSGYRNLTYPKMDENNRLFYIENGLDIDPRLVIVDKSGVETINSVTDEYSISGSQIIYTKNSTDPRWLYRGYSDIYKYNLESGEESKLTTNSRYFSPVYSSNGKHIVTVEHSVNRITSLVILNSESGVVEKRVEFKDFDIISGLSWNDNDTKIVFSSISDAGSSLIIYDLLTNTRKVISSTDNIEKSSPLFYNNYVLFVSSYSGINNINAIDLETGLEYQVLSSRFGADFPSLQNNKLIFSNYTPDGYQVYGFNLNENEWKDITLVERDHVDYFSPLLPTIKPPLNNLEEYEVKTYNPNSHLIDVHSWLVNPFTPVLQKSDVYNVYRDNTFDVSEIVLYSNDNLEYLDSTFYAHYNNKTTGWDLGSYGIYRGIYPKIAFDLNIFSKELNSGITSLSAVNNINFSLNFIDDAFSTGIIPDYYHVFDGVDRDIFNMSYYFDYTYDNNGFSITPTISLSHGLVGSNFLSLDFTTEGTTPGFFNEDELSIYSSLIWELNNSYVLVGSNISKPQFALLDFDDARDSFFSYNNIEYAKPVLYPDLSIFNWIYFKSLDLYTGYESFYSESSDYNQLVSSRLSLTYNFLRMPIDLSTGFTVYYDITDSEWNYTFTILTFNSEDI